MAVRRNCPRRSLDAARLLHYLKLNGWVPVDSPRSADLSVVWTCGGFDCTEMRSLRTVKRAIANGNGNHRVIVTGCLLRIHPEALDGLPAEFIYSDDLADLDAIIGADVPFAGVPEVGLVSGVSDLLREPVSVRVRRQLRTIEGLDDRVLACLRCRLSFLRETDHETRVIPADAYRLLVGYGCLSACSYCAVRLSMGRLRSRPLLAIMSQFEEAIAEGHRTFVLIGEDVGAYGVDLGLSVCDLLRELLSVSGDQKIIINDFNALWLVRYRDELIDILERFQERVEGLVIPIQSGSDRILQLMRRRYEIGDVERALEALKRRVPGLRICTHVLVGFPSETEEDFRASLRLVQRHNFWHTDVFAYEERAMTPSASITPKIPPGTIVKRARLLAKIADQHSGRKWAKAPLVCDGDYHTRT